MRGKSNTGKRDAVALVRSSPHRSVTEIARELGMSPEGLRGWVKQAKIDQGERPAGSARADKSSAQVTVLIAGLRLACS